MTKRFYQREVITKLDWEKRNGHKGAVIWLTGLPSSGKTTISTAIEQKLFKANVHVFRLDGDKMREGLNSDLGFSAEARTENIRRAGEVAKLFFEAGMIVLAAFISPYRKDREKVRALFHKGDFIEVYVKADIETCKKRDVKGLYKKALAGKIANLTGISGPYEKPLHPEIILDTDKFSVVEEVNKVIKFLIAKKVIRSYLINTKFVVPAKAGT